MNQEEIEKNRAYKREYMRKYNATEKGKEYNRAHVKSYRKRVGRKESRKISSEWREALIFHLLDRDGPWCQICGNSLVVTSDGPPSLNHVKPVALGGEHRIENYNLTHKLCNYEQALSIRKQALGH